MSTLTTDPVASVLRRLFDEAEAARPYTRQAVADLSDDDQQRMMTSREDYVELYSRFRDVPLAVSRETGALLYMLVRSTGARSIVEFGTSFGTSTLHMAAALKDNGGGKLITSEFEPSKLAIARQNLAEGGLIDLVEFRAGDALQTLRTDLPDTVDLLLLDGAKALYPEVLSIIESRLKKGAFIIADNADYSPDYLAYVRNPANSYLSVPFGDDVELSMRM